jgi:hypothetical protein
MMPKPIAIYTVVDHDMNVTVPWFRKIIEASTDDHGNKSVHRANKILHRYRAHSIIERWYQVRFYDEKLMMLFMLEWS